MSESRCSKVSRNQEVALDLRNTFENQWCFEYIDPKLRFEMNGIFFISLIILGEPVKLSDQILIKHCFTQQWMASDNNN